MKIYLIQLLFLVYSINSYSQNISAEVQYSCSVHNNPFANELANKKKMDTTAQHIKDAHKKFIELAVPISYTLKFNTTASSFEKNRTMTNDANSGFNITEAMGATGVIYTNLVTHLRVNILKSEGGTLIIKGDINDTKWKLTKIAKQIGDQQCFKATTEYKYMAGKNGDQLIVQPVTAWYTLDIPVGFGPAGYGNLPGLIINLEIGDIIYQMTDLKLNTKKDTVIKTPKLKGRTITEREYNGF